MMLTDPWMIAAGAVIVAELAAYTHHEKRRRQHERDSHISARALDRLNGRR